MHWSWLRVVRREASALLLGAATPLGVGVHEKSLSNKLRSRCRCSEHTENGRSKVVLHQ